MGSCAACLKKKVQVNDEAVAKLKTQAQSADRGDSQHFRGIQFAKASISPDQSDISTSRPFNRKSLAETEEIQSVLKNQQNSIFEKEYAQSQQQQQQQQTQQLQQLEIIQRQDDDAEDSQDHQDKLILDQVSDDKYQDSTLESPHKPVSQRYPEKLANRRREVLKDLVEEVSDSSLESEDEEEAQHAGKKKIMTDFYEDTDQEDNNERENEQKHNQRDQIEGISNNNKNDDDSEDLEDEELAAENELKEEEDRLFSIEGIIYESQKNQKSKDKPNILGLDAETGRTYIIKQYSAQQAKELEFDRELALKVWRIQKIRDCFCETKAINVRPDQGIDIVQSHEKGGSLELFLDTPFAEKDAKIWITKILDALRILHEHNLVHGNVKPSNILIGEGSLKLADINVFKKIHYTNSFYSSPEVLLSNKLSAKSDIWSAGIIFIQVIIKYTHTVNAFLREIKTSSLLCLCFQMLSGVMPFLQKEPDMTLQQFKAKINRIKLQLPFAQNIQEFIAGMISQHPTARKSARELLNSAYLKDQKPSAKELKMQLSQSIEHMATVKKFNPSKQILSSSGSQSKHMSDANSSEQPSFSLATKRGQNPNNSLFENSRQYNTKYGQTSMLSYFSVINIKDQQQLTQQDSYIPISVLNLQFTTQQQLTDRTHSASFNSNSINSITKNGTNKTNDNINAAADQQKNAEPSSSSALPQAAPKRVEDIPRIARAQDIPSMVQFGGMNTQRSRADYDDGLVEKQEIYKNLQDKYMAILKSEKAKSLSEDFSGEEEDAADDENSSNTHANRSALRDSHLKAKKQIEIEQQLLDILNQVCSDDDEEGNNNNNSFEQAEEVQSILSQEHNNEEPLSISNLADRITSQPTEVIKIEPPAAAGGGGALPFQKPSFDLNANSNINNSQNILSNNSNLTNNSDLRLEKIHSTNSHYDNHNIPLSKQISSKPTLRIHHKNEQQVLDEMNRILDANATCISEDSMQEIKKQLSIKDLTGLKRMLSHSPSMQLYQPQLVADSKNQNTNQNGIQYAADQWQQQGISSRTSYQQFHRGNSKFAINHQQQQQLKQQQQQQQQQQQNQTSNLNLKFQAFRSNNSLPFQSQQPINLSGSSNKGTQKDALILNTSNQSVNSNSNQNIKTILPNGQVYQINQKEGYLLMITPIQGSFQKIEEVDENQQINTKQETIDIGVLFEENSSQNNNEVLAGQMVLEQQVQMEKSKTQINEQNCQEDNKEVQRHKPYTTEGRIEQAQECLVQNIIDKCDSRKGESPINNPQAKVQQTNNQNDSVHDSSDSLSKEQHRKNELLSKKAKSEELMCNKNQQGEQKSQLLAKSPAHQLILEQQQYDTIYLEASNTQDTVSFNPMFQPKTMLSHQNTKQQISKNSPEDTYDHLEAEIFDGPARLRNNPRGDQQAEILGYENQSNYFKNTQDTMQFFSNFHEDLQVLTGNNNNNKSTNHNNNNNDTNQYKKETAKESNDLDDEASMF